MPGQSPAVAGRGRLVRYGAAFVVLLALAGYLVVQYEGGGRPAPRCTVVGAGGAAYEMTYEQAENAATISAVGTAHKMPERAVTIALATALQESGLRNISHGDRDSVGLFQQRPSQGWGTVEQIMDPVYSAGKFYDGLKDVPGYSRLPLTVAAQKVQRSGFPQAYAKHEPDAALLSAALTGRAAGALKCEGPAAVQAGDPAEVRSLLARDFGKGVLPRTESAGAEVTDDKKAAEQERTVHVPVTAGDERRGWELAQWAVAQASALHLERVVYDGREWVAGENDGQWRDAGPGAGSGKDAGAAEVLIVTAS
ncbi:heavy metal transporter [Streptomyces sp. TRM66268-LWL]|uniref:Heavy metal transporter n=1 Tax=Streptomyces polyasparticus TaxID=2767826 RepID=A0ABR7S6J7_9ACTN|nr:heavy metal transporter [Streptomyces polyasparticus]MBC9711080.1 heavy metal transporter [Streptomyces polyasparticus]